MYSTYTLARGPMFPGSFIGKPRRTPQLIKLRASLIQLVDPPDVSFGGIGLRRDKGV